MDFLRRLHARGLTGNKWVISDAHGGLRNAIERVRDATWQRCRVHWMRNALAHVSRGRHTVVAAAIRQAFDRPDCQRDRADEASRMIMTASHPIYTTLTDVTAPDANAVPLSFDRPAADYSVSGVDRSRCVILIVTVSSVTLQSKPCGSAAVSVTVTSPDSENSIRAFSPSTSTPLDRVQ